MKATIFSLIIINCFTIIILTSCESHEEKAEAADAFEQVKQKKMTSDDSISISKALISQRDKTEVLKKSESVDEWTKFKNETEKKISENDTKIKNIKAIPDASSKLLRQVTSLEKDNNDLRKRMDEYKEELKVRWESFKIEINHDANQIEIELKDLSINNKK